MSNTEIAICVVVFVLIWVVLAFLTSLVIKAGQKLWKNLKSKFDPDETA
ncbi:MAG: hypothetical protein R3Y06_04885 [Faecalibacterium sp.]